MEDIILRKIKCIQQEYLLMLKNVESKIFVTETRAIFDELDVFWRRHMNTIRLFLEYYCKENETYFYTAATILDVQNKEHYPFLMFGQCHIWDDPIYSYSVLLQSDNISFCDKIELQIKNTIINNIEILEKLGEHIVILPIRIIMDIDSSYYTEIIDGIFFSMFKDNLTKDEYFHLKKIENIDVRLKSEAKEFILFDEHYDNDTFINRYNKFYSSKEHFLKNPKSDACMLYMHLYGLWAQVIHIIEIASTYNVVPLLRYELSMNYFLEIGKICMPKGTNEIFTKAMVAFAQHKLFDYDISKLELEKFLFLIKDFDYERKVNTFIAEKGYMFPNVSFTDIAEILNKHWSEFIDENGFGIKALSENTKVE